ncbi:hypothetical protein N9W69_02855 [Flavobacteriaceae bacterium]|nr:hypothetical protein [Flavobacteriaceae bacterium]
MKVTVLYPQPLNQEKFESDYNAHLKLLHEKTGIPTDVKPYSITRFLSGPEGKPPFHLMFIMPFESQEQLVKNRIKRMLNNDFMYFRLMNFKNKKTATL